MRPSNKLKNLKPSLPDIQDTQPASNIAEISLFGPGVGECIVIHMGAGQWFIIDSCLCPKTNEPIALSYLRSIGVDYANKVIGILISHWHSDHIRGASKLLKHCTHAKLYCSSALFSKEALTLTSLYKANRFTDCDKNTEEFSSIVNFLHGTNDPRRLEFIKARHTVKDIRQENHVPVRLIALSPSNMAVTQSIVNLVKLQPKEKSQRTRAVVPQSENLNAVAIHFTFGQLSVILGSDLENHDNENTGWKAVFNDGMIADLSLSKAHVFKVSHHGGQSGNHDRIWCDLLHDKPLAITTTFSRSHLPCDDDIERLKKQSKALLITRDPTKNKKIKHDKMVERELRSIAKERITVNTKNMGHIQIRATEQGKLTVGMNEHAVRY